MQALRHSIAIVGAQLLVGAAAIQFQPRILGKEGRVNVGNQDGDTQGNLSPKPVARPDDQSDSDPDVSDPDCGAYPDVPDFKTRRSGNGKGSIKPVEEAAPRRSRDTLTQKSDGNATSEVRKVKTQSRRRKELHHSRSNESGVCQKVSSTRSERSDYPSLLGRGGTKFSLGSNESGVAFSARPSLRHAGTKCSLNSNASIASRFSENLEGLMKSVKSHPAVKNHKPDGELAFYCS